MSKRSRAGSVCWTTVLALVVTGTPGVAQDSPYRRTEEAFGQLPPGRTYGSSTGVYAAPDGQSIWIIDRCGQNSCAERPTWSTVFRFDTSGRLMTEFGAGLIVWPHSLFVDREGNVWVPDGAAATGIPETPGMGHVVYKFSPEGRLLMTLGQKGVAGRDRTTFTKPTAVAVAPNGDIFVADGHGPDGSNRIVRFDRNGRYVTEWGSTGNQAGQFQEPHAVAVDSQGRVFVGDRGNNRTQIFDADGKHLATWTQFGRPSGLYIDANDVLYSTDSQSDADRNPGFRRGVYIGSVRDGRVTRFIPDPLPNSMAETVTTDAMGNVYVGETGTVRVHLLETPRR